MKSLDLRFVVFSTLCVTSTCGVLSCGGTHFEVETVVERGHAIQYGIRVDETLAEADCERICYAAIPYQYRIVRLDECRLEPVEADADAVHVVCSGLYRWLQDGRRPWAPLAGDRQRGPDHRLGALLAEFAYLEAASIFAFHELATQLEHFGAPSELIARCRAAAEDERRHANVLGTLAGVSPIEPRVQARRQPNLFEFARHNAVEGCVLESFAALLACVRAESAADPAIRAAYREIADDELRHGQLAWDIHAWVCTRLDPAAYQEVLAERARALAELPERAEALAGLPPAVQRLDRFTARRLALEFAGRLAAA